MRNFKKKLNGQEGFTLVEMLIVVAIIAILIAVSIPIIRSALDKARHSTDAANERAAKAAILVRELSDTETFSTGVVYLYDAKNGKLVDSGTAPTGYGQHKASSSDDHKNKFIAIKVTASTPSSPETVVMTWTTNASDDLSSLSTLCSEKNVSH